MEKVLSSSDNKKFSYRMIDPELYRTEVEPDLDRFGDRVASEIWDLGRQCELEPPYLKPSPWGSR